MSVSKLVTFALSKANPKVGVITLNSPSTLNAVNFQMGAEFNSLTNALCQTLTGATHNVDPYVAANLPQLTSAQLELPADTHNINSIVLTGAGKAFSAGGSFDFLYSRTDSPPHVNAATMYNFYKMFLSVRNLPIPVVTAINGPAVGAAACLTLATEYRVMNSNAVIGFNFCRIGIHPGMGGSHFLPRLIGQGKANRMLLGGRLVNGAEAESMGLIDEVVQVEKGTKVGDESCPVLQRGIEIASEFSNCSPVASRGALRSLRMRVDDGLEESLRREADQQALCYARNDWKEGLDAVKGKREPKFDPHFSY